ncbi:hypothetical protein H072_6934 [Dactylellina haptotyla CBS 200.50]|uniref:Major facilitator superfamily (MFS) profile domain-containing protein n=1 Tax=Dactylellina haptotyla (strain CBS 200.50) TaxID=1284197 RepID=S8BIW7_DACHA|nr:hypothetical protein H072_6934 [Dactylellina haptotyla CBS 200.50]
MSTLHDEKRPASANGSSDLEAQKPASIETSNESGTDDLNIGMLLTALDFNIVAPAAPIISSQFNEFSNSAWLGSGFLISFALVLPIYTKLGDIFGRRDLFIFGTVVFIIGSALCGAAKSMSMLIWSRVVQGAGAGGIYGLVNVIITDLVPLRDAGKYLATTALVWALADVAGPLLGGIFSQYVSWRWCFYINLCISPLSLIVTVIYLRIPAPKVALGEKLKNLDYVGMLTMPGATVCLLLALQWGGNTFPWSDGRVIGCFVGSAALFAIFLVNVFKFAKDPLIPAYFFKNRTILAVAGAEFAFGANLVGMMYYVPQFFQIVFGDNAIISGVGLIPMMVGLLFGNPIAAQVTSKKGLSKINAIWGGLIMILMTGLVTRWNTHTSRAEAVVLLFFLGLGQGAVFSGLLLTAQVAVPPQEIGVATGLVIFAQTVGDIFGVAVFGTLYINKLHPALMSIPGLTPENIVSISRDIHFIRKDFNGLTQELIIGAHANAMQYGWWLMFAFAAATVAFSLLAKQGKFA